MTQQQVAKALKRTQTWVSKSELGERRADFVDQRYSLINTGHDTSNGVPFSNSDRAKILTTCWLIGGDEICAVSTSWPAARENGPITIGDVVPAQMFVLGR